MTASDSPSNANQSWLQENVLDPAGSALKESANTGINLLNLVLSPTGEKLDKFEVAQNPHPSATASLVTGLVSMVPYAIAGGVVGKVMSWVPMSEGAAVVLRSNAFTQTLGAAGFDGFRDLRPGETPLGNILGTAAGFGAFELGNSRLRGLSFLAALPARAAVGVVGGIAQSTFSDLGSGRAPDFSRLTEAGITGGGMNILLPTMQYAVARTLRLPLRSEIGSGADQGAALPANSTPLRQRDAVGVLLQNPDLESVPGEATGLAPPKNPALELVQAEATAAVPPEEKPAVPPPPTVNLAELPAFAVLSNIGAHLRWEEEMRAAEHPDLSTLTYAVRAMRNAEEAKANMQQIAAGKLSPATADYIARGWLPADSLEQMQARLRSDLQQAHWPGSDTTNLEDLAAYGHQFIQMRPKPRDLIDQYQGSTTRLALRSLGVESETLGLLSYHADGLEISANREHPGLAHLQDVGAIQTPGLKSVDLKSAAEARRAIDAAERGLANPQTREATLLDLKSNNKDLDALVSRYAPADRGAGREPGPVDLRQYDNWQYTYRLLGKLQGTKEEGLNGRAQEDTAFWTSRALRHMEQIATGDLSPAVLSLFNQNPEVLNAMRAQLEQDLSRQYLTSSEPLGKQDGAVIWSQLMPLVAKYEESPVYHFIKSIADVPVGLTRLISDLRFNDPSRTPAEFDRNMKAVYALERGLLDPEKRESTLQDLADPDWMVGRPKLIDRYAREFDRLYSDEQPMGAPGDYSTVVPFKPRTAGGRS